MANVLADGNIPTTFSIPQPQSRSLYFTKQVDQSSIADISQRIIEINEGDRFLELIYTALGQSYTPAPIKIYIDSYGGYVYQCFGLLSLMDTSKTPIHTYVTGTAMSCGFMIAIHGHKRFCYDNSTLMYHQVSGGAFGQVKSMEESVVEAKRLQESIEKMTLRRTNMTKAQLQSIYDSKIDLYMDAQTSLENGCVDEIIESDRVAFAAPSKKVKEPAATLPTVAEIPLLSSTTTTTAIVGGGDEFGTYIDPLGNVITWSKSGPAKSAKKPPKKKVIPKKVDPKKLAPPIKKKKKGK